MEVNKDMRNASHDDITITYFQVWRLTMTQRTTIRGSGRAGPFSSMEKQHQLRNSAHCAKLLTLLVGLCAVLLQRSRHPLMSQWVLWNDPECRDMHFGNLWPTLSRSAFLNVCPLTYQFVLSIYWKYIIASCFTYCCLSYCTAGLALSQLRGPVGTTGHHLKNHQWYENHQGRELLI